MKNFSTLLLLAGLGFPVSADAQQRTRADSVQVIIELDNSINGEAPVDSVLVIFDRYNLTGAGTIKQIFYPVNNKVVIDQVPRGKFYITVICLGIYSDNFSDVNYVYEKRRNKNAFCFRLKASEYFDPATVKIPAEKIDPSQLVILKKRPVRFK